MLAIPMLCQWRPELFIEGFPRQPDAVAVGSTYLRVISWNFLATGLIFTCSGLFQALGNTWPSLLSSGARLLTFVLPAVWLSTLPHFSLMQVWYLSVASVTMQALTSLALLQRELRRDRKSTRLNSSHSQISYAVFCLKKKKKSTHLPSPAKTILITS